MTLLASTSDSAGRSRGGQERPAKRMGQEWKCSVESLEGIEGEGSGESCRLGWVVVATGR